jgi:DNA polymerase (family 10)
MDKRRVVETLEAIASLLELQDENPFKVRAYRNAARALDARPEEIRVLVDEDRLGDVPGIGEAIRDKVVELVRSGRLEYFEKLRASVPAGVVALLDVPSLGPKKARQLWKELGVEDLDALRKACEQGRLRDLKGFGEKSQAKILEGLRYLQQQRGRFLLSEALPHARRLLELLRGVPGVVRAEICGSLRRWKEVVKDVDLLVSATDPAAVMKRFAAAEGVTEILAGGDTKTSVRLVNGLQADLRVVTDAQFPCALNYFTGSKEHNVALRGRAQDRGLKLSEYALSNGSNNLEISSEEDLYRALGLPYLPPELRENGGELDLKKSLQLIDYKHLTGTFHSHTSWSDGVHGIEAMAEKARGMGLGYLGLSDHSQAAIYAHGLDEARLAKQIQEVDRLNRRWKDFRILKGLECDILPDGSLDLSPAVLAGLDFVIGSVHSGFEMSEQEMTDRVCKALANEHLDILGHPTGRLLLSREGYRIDLERVLQTAAREEKVVELNAYPNRLDLDWTHCRRAKELGVPIAINPDAHSVDDLENLHYGIGTGRRGWLEQKDVFNTRDLDDVLEAFRA